MSERVASEARRAYLVGFMGCGKGAVGVALARRLGWGFHDLDAEVERRAGATVAEIFATRGEAAFRALEREALAATAELAPVVVATGGGTFVDPDNATLVARLGRSVHLEVPFEVILARLDDAARQDRPLFRDRESAQRLYARRLAAYRRADVQIRVGPTTTPEALAGRIAPYFRGEPCAT